jgi:hypothetical protein
MAPKIAQDGSKMAQDAHDGTKMSQDGPKKGRDVPKVGQGVLKMAPRWPQDTPRWVVPEMLDFKKKPTISIPPAESSCLVAHADGRRGRRIFVLHPIPPTSDGYEYQVSGFI